MKNYLIVLFPLIIACNKPKLVEDKTLLVSSNQEDQIPDNYLARKFDFPVGKPDAKGYYNAQPFGKNTHLGDDWNAVTGGDSDLGDTIYAIANGQVLFAEDMEGGWGNVIRIGHYLPDGRNIESLYAHCNEIFVKEAHWLDIGDPIGTIGNAGGIYSAHLHLEIRERIGMPIGAGYSSNTFGYLNPEKFISENRNVE